MLLAQMKNKSLNFIEKDIIRSRRLFKMDKVKNNSC